MTSSFYPASRMAANSRGTMMPASQQKKYLVENLNEINPVRCPCGTSRRAFVSPDNSLATMHYVRIEEDAQTHYHKKLTEIYLILECERDACMELDGERVPVQPMSTIMIK